MDLGIGGRRAVVTASSSGLGLGAARALAAEGAEVILAARSPDRLAVAARSIESSTGVRPRSYTVDLGDGQEVDRFVDDVHRDAGPVDILVANTGGPPAKRFLECTPEDWDEAFRLLLLSTVRLVRGFLPDMLHAGWGRIVCITSIAAKEPVENLVLSNSLRAAVTGMAKSLAREVGPRGVLVNTVAPGYHDTPALQRLVDKLIEQGKAASRDEVLRTWRQATPLDRLGDPDAFGRVVAFLASNACDYLTGTNVLVDGGRARSTF